MEEVALLAAEELANYGAIQQSEALVPVNPFEPFELEGAGADSIDAWDTSQYPKGAVALALAALGYTGYNSRNSSEKYISNARGKESSKRKRTIPDYYPPRKRTPDNAVPRLHRKFTPPDNNNMSTPMQVVSKYLWNKENVESTGKIAYASPIIFNHRMRIPSNIARAKCSISGHRTIELNCDVGRLASKHISYSFKDELDNMHVYAQKNLIAQTGLGTKASLTEGVTADISAQAYQNQLKSIILGQTRIYDIANMCDKSCYLTVYVVTPKVDSAPSLTDCIVDTSFESINGISWAKWADNIPAGNDDRTQAGIMDVDEHKFNFFKHRYKVRRNYRKLAKRTIYLNPGQRTRIKILETGPQLISKIYLDEAGSPTAQIRGYTKTLRFELRGADVVGNSSAGNTQVTKSSANVAIVESMSIRLMGIMTTRYYHTYLSQQLGGSLTASDSDSYNINSYGRLPTFSTTLQTNINTLTEAKEDGVQNANS